MGEWTLYLRAPDLTRVGIIDDFQQVDAVPRHNDVGTWAVDIDSRVRHATALARPGYGIDLVRGGVSVMSGDMRFRQRIRDGHRSRLLVSGYDDNGWLNRRVAHPQPSAAAPPYSVDAYDVRTGLASTVLRQYVDVNGGPSALAVRRITGLTLAADPLIGSTVTGRARWQSLLVLLQELALAGGGLGFHLRRSATSRVFTVYQPVDRTATVRFSTGLGNLAGYEYQAEAPSANYLFVGGGGEGTARTVREGQDPESIVDFGRIEIFRDRRDTTDSGELDQEITKTLDESAGRTGISITPIETTRLRYLTDYTLGDKVTALLDDEPIKEVIREVRIKLTPAGPQQMLPEISSPGSPGIAEVMRIFRRLRAFDSRLTNLERR